MDIDRSYNILLAIKSDLEKAIADLGSEQDARLKLINRMLVEVLGWSLDQITTEPHTEHGFVDYVLGDGKGRALAVLEAKRVGALPLDTSSGRQTTVTVGGQVLRPAQAGVSQAMTYCTEVGTSYAVLSDGATWVFFRATRSDGLAPRDGKAIVFPSLEAVIDAFALFFELLAPSALIEQLHFARLNSIEGGQVRPPEPRYFVRPPNEARLQPRTDLARDITEIFNRFFASISSEHDHEMRTACFVESRESREADTTLSKIAVHLTNLIRSIETEHGRALSMEIESVISSQISEICLIVGNKGAGKSTFITRFFNDVMTPDLRSSCVMATIDLSQYAGGEKTIQQWLAERLRDVFEEAIFSDQSPTYEDYMGMFFSTYQRWSEGTHRHLYETDKTGFKIKFGEYVENRREEKPHDYALGLLLHTVAGRRRLPCLVFDNTDQFPASIQETVFQYAISLRNSSLCFILIPVTDRSVWRLSKAGPLQSYLSRSFYLPTPETREVLARRVGYLRTKLDAEARNAGNYFSSRGIRISIRDLSAFTNIIEEAFVYNDGMSGLLGRLSNHDIRRMLLLAQRVITSPTLSIDNLVKSVFTPKGAPPFDFRRALRAMIVGEYDRHTNESNDFIMNVFWSEGSRPFSPLLMCSILEMLLSRKIASGDDVAMRYMTVSNLMNVFEPCGASRDETRYCIAQLTEFRLVEPFDPSEEALTDGSKIGLTSSGEAHLDMVKRESVYIEQMAVGTGLRFVQTRDAIAAYARDMGSNDNRDAIKAHFVGYLLDEDAVKLVIPAAESFSPLRALRREIAIHWNAEGSTAPALRSGGSSRFPLEPG